MAHVIFCPDSTGKTGSIYVGVEIGNGTRLLSMGTFVCDKVAVEWREVIMAAVRDQLERDARK